MLKISVNPKVLEALASAFPTPIGTSSRALDKYLRTLEKLLFNAIQFGRNPEQRKLDTYGISLQRLANLGGQIGPKRKRVHAWLRENKLELVKTVMSGSNLTGRVSDVKLTELVHLETLLVLDHDAINMLSTDAELEAYLAAEIDQQDVNLIYPQLEGKSDFFTSNDYDPLEVDQESVRSYIKWISDKANLMTHDETEHALKQARIILAACSSTGSIYYQRKQPSEFGRMYYSGVSVQNINKQLRNAVLGNCWEYDIRSSVVAWKMGFASLYLDSLGNTSTLDSSFRATVGYLEDKDDFMRTVRHFVYLDGARHSREFQTKLLKQAITAISFGARATSVGWHDMAGNWTNPALVSILKNPEDRARFLGDPTIRKFIQEQNVLDDFIFSLFKTEAPELLSKPCLQTPSGRLSKSKVLAYWYQHSETQVMDIVRSVAAVNGQFPIASVHDAIFFRNKLGVDLKHEIEMQMCEQTQNQYWSLSASQHYRYSSVAKDVFAEEKLHKIRIQAEEKLALECANTLLNI